MGRKSKLSEAEIIRAIRDPCSNILRDGLDELGDDG
jgi:hypothetical protein